MPLMIRSVSSCTNYFRHLKWGLVSTFSYIHLIYLPTVPGPASDLTALPKFTSIDLTWSAPQEPNGVIISYEVAYRVTGSNLVTTNTCTTDLSTTFSISSLTPQTTVSDISVSAYTSIGRGEAAIIADQTTREEPRECLYSIGSYIR